MGLQNNMKEIAYDSIPVLLLTIIPTAVRHLRSAFFAFLHRIVPDEGLSDLVGSGLASLIVIAEQLNVNIACSKELKDELNGSNCVVCLCELRKGERLRRLECRHIFHRKCLNAWLKQLHFTCPLCRSPVPMPTPTPAAAAASRMDSELISWFGIR